MAAPTSITKLTIVLANGEPSTQGSKADEDEEGLELPNEEAARQKAIEGLRDIMASEMRSGGLNMASFIEIEDGNGLVMTVQFLDAVNITTEHSKRR